MKTVRNVLTLSVFLFAFVISSCDKDDDANGSNLENTPADVLRTLEQMFLENDLSIGDAIFADSVVYKNNGQEMSKMPWNNPEDMGYEFVHFFPRWFVLEPWRNYHVDDYQLKNVNVDETLNTKAVVQTDEYILAYSEGNEDNPILGTDEPIIITMEPIGNKWFIIQIESFFN